MTIDNTGRETFFEDVQRLEILNGLLDSYNSFDGLAVIMGESGSGITTLVEEFTHRLRLSRPELADLNVAVIDASQTTVAGMLCELLAVFGYELPEATDTELLSITQLISQHQADAGIPPLVIVEHVDRAHPAILATINKLAGTRHRRGSACRMILTGTEHLRPIVAADAMAEVGKRAGFTVSLTPLTQDEQRRYVAHRLGNLGLAAHDNAFEHLGRLGGMLPRDIEDIIAVAASTRNGQEPIGSGDVLLAIEACRKRQPEPESIAEPAPLVDVAAKAQEQTATAGVAPAAEQDTSTANALGEMLVSHNGKLIQHYLISRRKVLIGRAPHNDIVLDSKWVSRHHAIIVCKDNGATLVDINSTNGMTINSRAVRQGALTHNDVVVIGEFRIKYRNKNALQGIDNPELELDETRVVPTLDDAPADADATVITERRKA